MTTNRIGALQVVRYTPLGARLHVIPDSGLVFASTPAGGTLQLTISEELYQELPDEIEVAVEQWQGGPAFGLPGWVEMRDGRFSLTSQGVDKADVAGMVRITGQALVPWMGEGAFLSGVDPYQMTGLTVIGAKVLTGVSASGSTFTKSSHGLSNGDRVRVEEAGKLNKAAVKQGGVYYVKVLGSSTFQLTSTLGAAVIKSVGTSSGDVKLERLRDQIMAPGHQFKNGDRVSVSAADGSGLNDGSSYFIVRDGGNAFGLSNEAGGPAIELNSNTLNVFRDLDAERVFKGTQATPGYIVGKAFAEAQARNGWGAGLTRDFSGVSDSAGNAWLDMLEDEPGIPIGFKPGTSLSALLAFMVDQSVGEFATEGRMLRLWNYGLGTDRSIGNTPVLLGRHATSIPVKKDLNSMASHIRVRGEGPVQVDVSQTPGAFGPLEMYISAGGVTTTKLATAVGKQKLKTTKDPQRQYAVVEHAAEARFLAGRDYQRGEYVLALVSRKSPTPGRFRVAEIQWTKDADANVEVATVLGDRITTSPLARLAALARKQSGGISVGGNGSPVAVQDFRQPAAPTNVTAESVGVFSGTGAPVGSVVATWTGVTSDIDGLAIYVDQYELWIREDGQLKGSPRGRVGGLLAEAGPFPSGRTLLVSVRARSTQGVWGPLSDEVEVVTATPIEPPLPPTAPTVTSEAGVATLVWDGQLVDPDDGPVDPELGFDHVYFEHAEDVSGAPGAWTVIGGHLGRGSSHPDADVSAGTAYWWRARAVSTVGVASQPSAAAGPHTVAGVGESDLDPSLFAVVTSANGKNQTTFATTDPDPDPAGRNPGDLWWKRLGTVAVGLWVWDGDSWEPQALANEVLASLDVAKLVAGAALIDTAVVTKLVAQILTAGRIQSQMINVGAHVPTGSSSQRVPAPLTDLSFWGQVTSGAVAFTTWGADSIGIRGVVAGTSGLVLTPTATDDARLYLMQRAKVPDSGRVHTRLASGGANARLWLVWFTAAGAATEVLLTNNAEFVFPATAVEYTVRVQLAAAAAIETVAFASIFEAIGSGSGMQRTTVSPGGVKSYSDDGSAMVSIGTETDQFVSLWKNTAAGPEVQAAIDSNGRGTFKELVLNGDMTVRGYSMFGTSIVPALRNGFEDVVPLMQRFSNGGGGGGYFEPPAVTVTSAWRSLAAMAVELQAGRQYRLSITSGCKITNTGAGTADIEVLVSDAPFSVSATSGFTELKSILIRAGEVYHDPFDMNRMLRTSPSIYTNLTLFPGTNYLMLRLRNPNASSLEIELENARGTILFEDVGPEFEELQDVTSALTSGTPTPPGSSVTKDFTASWTRSWIGSSIISGGHSSSPGADRWMLYQGLGPSTHMASMFGFPALGISGKTISACSLFLQNRATYNPNGVTALLGTSGLTAAPSARPGARVNPFTGFFTRSSGKYVPVPSSLWASIASGAIRSFVLGDPSSSDANEYGAFDGDPFEEDEPPVLRVTYK